MAENEELVQFTLEYVAAMKQLLKVPRHDNRDNQITSFLASEEAKVVEAIYLFAHGPWGKWRAAIELPRDARKHVVIFLGLFSCIIQQAKATSRKVILLLPDDYAKNVATGWFVGLKFIVDNSVEFRFATWDKLELSTPLSSLWVIGDLDWSFEPLTGDRGKRATAAVKRVLSDGACHTILLHQEGRISMLPFPPEFILAA